MIKKILGIAFYNLLLVSLTISPIYGRDANHLSIGDHRSRINYKPVNKNVSGISISSYYWEKLTVPAGINLNEQYAFAVHPVDGFTILLGASNGIYKSIDAGESWVRLDNSPSGYVYQIIISPSNPQRIYARTSEGFYRSDDSGDTWTYLASTPHYCGIFIAPSDQNRLFARKCGVSPDESAIYRSDNGGDSWYIPNPTFTENILEIAVTPDQPNILLARDRIDIFRSENGGENWQKTWEGLAQTDHKIMFDPQQLNVVFYNDFDMMRSFDGGLNWEHSDFYRSSSTFIPSPFNSNELLGARNDQGWEIASSGYGWKSKPWSLPPNSHIEKIWRSYSNSQVVYASTNSSELWRYIYRTKSWPYSVKLPLIQSESNSNSFPANTQQALDRANMYRQISGIVPFKLDSAVNSAAQNHANYIMLNINDPSAEVEKNYHGEKANKPGFTGQTVDDRLMFTGYEGSGTEVMHFINDPIASVDGWMATVFHREPFLDPYFMHIGYGSGKNNRINVDVMDFGEYGFPEEGSWSIYTPPKLFSYPIDGQTGIPTSWDGGEVPDPLPPGASRPVGYPFTVYDFIGLLHINKAELRDGNGSLVPVHPNPSYCKWHCVFLIPVSPLKPNETYTVHITGDVSNVYEFDRTWSFTTGSN